MKNLEDVGDEVILRAVGPRRHKYYEDKWKEFRKEGVPLLDWNWAAFVFGWFWFAYRKMWLVCLSYYLVLFPVYELVARVGGKDAFLGGLFLVKFVLVPTFANQIYYLYVEAKARKLSSRGEKIDKIAQALRNRFQTIFDATESNPKLL